MARETTPSFIIEVEMVDPHRDFLVVETELEDNRVIYNTALGEYLKREEQMKRTKKYKKLVRVSSAIKEKLTQSQKQKNKELAEFYQSEKKQNSDDFKRLRKEFGLTEYSMHEYIKQVRHHFNGRVNSIIAQKTASRAWNTFCKKLFGKSKRIVFVKRGEMFSFEGKNNTTGWRYINRKIVSSRKEYSIKVKENDMYMKEALYFLESKQMFQYKNKDGEVLTDSYKVKYVRILKKVIRGKKRYFAQLVCAGYPPAKRDKKTGEMKYPLGKGNVGMDIGISTLAVVSENKVFLNNLGEHIKKIDDVEQTIRLLKRRLERSKRAMNPDYFDTKGRIKKGKKEWIHSNAYLKTKKKLKELYRKLALHRKYSHQYEANRLLMLGDTFYIEEMNFKGIQKRAKKTEKSEKTNKFKRKKRFGKSIAHRSPAMFVRILESKVLTVHGIFIKVKTTSFKASQYDHRADKNKKKSLSTRWHTFDDGEKVQRDLYSAFLLKNSNPLGDKPDRNSCLHSFEHFLKLHSDEIKRLERMPIVTLNSGIKIKMKKTARGAA